MSTRLPWIALACALVLSACGTPPQVKQLSAAQIQYFDAAISAVRVQSEVLLLAAEKIRDQAEKQIAATEQKALSDLQGLAVNTLPSQNPAQRTSTAQRMLSGAARSSQAAAEARAKLASDLATIKAKTQELAIYLAKMKEVQVALDAYLQSEQAGEMVVRDVLKQPTVQSLLATANALVPKVTEGLSDLTVLLKGLPAG